MINTHIHESTDLLHNLTLTSLPSFADMSTHPLSVSILFSFVLDMGVCDGADQTTTLTTFFCPSTKQQQTDAVIEKSELYV
jgi:hypothetical protein